MVTEASSNQLTMIPSRSPSFTPLPNSTSGGDNGKTLNVMAVSATLGVLIAFSLFSNIMVLMAFYAQPRLREVFYYPIISLALADLLCAVTAMPLYIVKKNSPENIDERLVCDLYRFTYFFTEYASITSLMAISIERFLVIHNPLKYRGFFSPKIMIVALVTCWLEALVVSTMPFYWRHPSDECTNSPTRNWSLMVISINVFFPFLVMFLCHCYIYYKTIKEFGNNVNKKQHRVSNHFTEAENWKAERKATISFTVVIGVFVLCWGPSTVYYFLRNVRPEYFSDSYRRTWGDVVSAMVKIFTFVNSCVNPVIYFWLNMDFRKAFIRVLKREWSSKKSPGQSRSRSGTVNSQTNVTRDFITQV